MAARFDERLRNLKGQAVKITIPNYMGGVEYTILDAGYGWVECEYLSRTSISQRFIFNLERITFFEVLEPAEGEEIQSSFTLPPPDPGRTEYGG